MNYDYRIKLKEKLISQLAITKVLFERKQITEEDFNSTVDKISKNPNYSEYVEKASDVAWTQVDLIIETEAKKDKDYKNAIKSIDIQNKTANLYKEKVELDTKEIEFKLKF